MTNNYKNFTKVLSDIIWASPFLGGREILDDALVNKKVVQDVERSGPKVVILKFNFKEVYDMECCRFLSAYEFHLWYIYIRRVGLPPIVELLFIRVWVFGRSKNAKLT